MTDHNLEHLDEEGQDRLGTVMDSIAGIIQDGKQPTIKSITRALGKGFSTRIVKGCVNKLIEMGYIASFSMPCPLYPL